MSRLTVLPGDWVYRAACRGVTPELFHAGDDDRSTTTGPRVQMAKQVCGRCPVRAECLDWALETGDKWAILGGTTGDERRGRPPRAARPGERACGSCGQPFAIPPRKPGQRYCCKPCAGRANAEFGRQLRAEREQVAA